jgi:hypothetical protein
VARALIQRLLELGAKADLLIYSIGAANARIPSYVHAGGFHHQLPAENGHFPPIFVYQWIGRASISSNFSAK